MWPVFEESYVHSFEAVAVTGCWKPNPIKHHDYMMLREIYRMIQGAWNLRPVIKRPSSKWHPSNIQTYVDPGSIFTCGNFSRMLEYRSTCVLLRESCGKFVHVCATYCTVFIDILVPCVSPFVSHVDIRKVRSVPFASVLAKQIALARVHARQF